MPTLHILFIKSGTYSETLDNLPETVAWTAPSITKAGDVGLVYVGGEDSRGQSERHIRFAMRATESASEGTPDPSWTDSRSGFFAEYDSVTPLLNPIGLYQIRARFPAWKQWRSLRGTRVHTVPKEHRSALAAWVVEENPKLRSLMRPWLDGTPAPEATVEEEPRYEGSVVRKSHLVYERSQKLRDAALRQAKPPLTCCVCGFNFGDFYGPEGVGYIEVHHKELVSTGPRKSTTQDLALLCSNCHTMAHWKSGATPRSIKTLQRLIKGHGKKAS